MIGKYTGTGTAEFKVYKNAADPLPTPIEGGSDDQKKDYKKWATDNGITGTAEINAVAFALDVKAADITTAGTIEKAVQAALDAVFTDETTAAALAAEVAKFSADYTPVAFTIEGYPNAEFIFVETTDITTANGKFFRLTAVFKPAN